MCNIHLAYLSCTPHAMVSNNHEMAMLYVMLLKTQADANIDKSTKCNFACRLVYSLTTNR